MDIWFKLPLKGFAVLGEGFVVNTKNTHFLWRPPQVIFGVSLAKKGDGRPKLRTRHCKRMRGDWRLASVGAQATLLPASPGALSAAQGRFIYFFFARAKKREQKPPREGQNGEGNTAMRSRSCCFWCCWTCQLPIGDNGAQMAAHCLAGGKSGTWWEGGGHFGKFWCHFWRQLPTQKWVSDGLIGDLIGNLYMKILVKNNKMMRGMAEIEANLFRVLPRDENASRKRAAAAGGLPCPTKGPFHKFICVYRVVQARSEPA